MSSKKELRYLLLTFCMLTLSVWSGKSQMVDPVNWTFSVKQVNDSIFELHFNAAIELPWHMYNQVVQKDGPEPTVFSFDPSSDFQRIDSVAEITKPL